MVNDLPVAKVTELGSLGVPQLKRIWSAALAARNGLSVDRNNEHIWDQTVLNALGLGLHQTMQYLFMSTPTFTEFENWIVATAGMPDPLRVARLQAIVNGQSYPEDVRTGLVEIEAMPNVLSEEDLAFWEEHGYIVLKNAVMESGRSDAEAAIWKHIAATPDSVDSWYRCRDDSGIMVELIQHPALEANRRSKRIHKAFAQLWGAADLWVTADRCGFHPPQCEGYPFPGPDLHWDVDFTQPLTFSTQGILYLTDTPPEQGALTLVPGFHKRVVEWLAQLPANADPQQQDLHALGSQTIGGSAGDMVIWHQWLPHGSRPNLGNKPRIVQYINLLPSGFPDLCYINHIFNRPKHTAGCNTFGAGVRW